MTYYPDENADPEEELDEHLKAELQWEAEMRAEESALRAESSDPASGMIQAVSMLDTKLQESLAREAALQQRLNEADQRIDELERDKQRLDALEGNFWDVRHHSTALADTGDYTSCVEIVGRWMEAPRERVIGENYNENLRAAIDQAMAADAYPPARPEYPELDAALDQLTKDSPEVGS